MAPRSCQVEQDGRVSALVRPVGAPPIGPDWLGAFAPDGDAIAGLAAAVAVTATDVLVATLTFQGIAPGDVLWRCRGT